MAGAVVPKIVRGKGWSTKENILYLKHIKALNLNEDVLDKDVRWTQCSTLVVEDPTRAATEIFDIRANSAVREHLKNMLTTTRSLSSDYSRQADAVECPSAVDVEGNCVDFEAEDFSGDFRNYTAGMYKHYSDAWAAANPSSKCSKAWWNLEVFIAVRLHCFMSDNQRIVVDKAKKDKGPSKMSAEQDAAKQAMEARKRKHEEEEAADIERKKTLVDNNILQTEALANISQAFATFIATPPPRARDLNEPVNDGRIVALETDVNELKGSMSALQTSQAQGFAAIMAQLNAMNPPVMAAVQNPPVRAAAVVNPPMLKYYSINIRVFDRRGEGDAEPSLRHKMEFCFENDHPLGNPYYNEWSLDDLSSVKCCIQLNWLTMKETIPDRRNFEDDCVFKCRIEIVSLDPNIISESNRFQLRQGCDDLLEKAIANVNEGIDLCIEAVQQLIDA